MCLRVIAQKRPTQQGATITSILRASLVRCTIETVYATDYDSVDFCHRTSQTIHTVQPGDWNWPTICEAGRGEEWKGEEYDT